MPHLHRTRHHKITHETIHEGSSSGIRILAWARAVRWMGWGLGEALIPVFIITFSKTFAEAGLMNATVDIAALACLPLIGLWADRVPAKRLILLALILYPIVGLGYFFAGIFGLAIFIVIARLANGFTWELENVGIETYNRRTIDRKHIASSFGYVDSLTHVAWIVSALVGIVLVRFLPIYYLLFAIVPFALIAYEIARRAPTDSPAADQRLRRPSFFSSYMKAATEWRTWNARLWLLSALILFSSIVSALMYFFIPIDAYLTGVNLPMVVLITVFGSIPALFGYKLGELADVRNKYAIISLGLIGVAVIAGGLAFIPQYWFKLVAIFLMGIILELFYVVQSSLITTLGPEETYGERGSAFESIVTVGDLIAPLILGIGLDLAGFSHVSFAVMVVAAVLAVIYRVLL